MLYQEYKQKLQKRKKVYDRLWKFRFPIMASVILLLATAGVLMGITGMSVDFSAPAEALVYGQEVSASTSCIFGDAVLQYRAIGQEEWTTNSPVYAGQYECRPVSKSVFGTTRVGEVKTFEIEPYPVNIRAYGDSYRLGNDIIFQADLINGDRLQVNDYSVSYENEAFSVTVDAGDIRAISKDGVDVSLSYIFSPQGKAMSVDKRPITIAMPSETLVYDGEPHAFVNAEADEGLLPGHHVVVSADSFITVGTHENSATDCKIFDENGNDLTAAYDIKFVPGTVDIQKRKITLGATLDEIVYDAEDHAYDYECELLDGTTLASGHRIEMTDLTIGKDVGSYENEGKIAIFSGNEDVTSNYDIDRQFPKMVISKRPITLKNENQSLTYDSAEHEFNNVFFDDEMPLLAGHSIFTTSPYKVKAAGEYVNKPEFRIIDEDENDVTKNYLVTEDFGVISVEQRKVTISTSSNEFWYSGMPNVPTSVEEAIPGHDALLQGEDEFTISYGVETMTVAKDYQNAPEIGIFNDGEDVKNNYDITFDYGTIKVKKRTLEFEIFDKSFVYNGTAQGEGEVEYTLHNNAQDGFGLVEGQELHVFNDEGREVCGEQGMRLSYKVLSAGQEVTENYIFNSTNGSLTITQRPIEIVTRDGDTFEYDGAPHFVPNIEISGLAEGQNNYVLSNIESQQTESNIGTYENKFTFRLNIYKDGGNEPRNDVTANYDVENALSNVEYGTITITKRSVVLTTQSASLTYDGKPHTESEIVADRLVDGHTAEADFASFTIPDTYENSPTGDVSISDADGNDVTQNYFVSWEIGKVTVTKRPISILTDSLLDYVYDGAPHMANSFQVVDKEGFLPLADGQQLLLSYDEWVNVGEYVNEPMGFVITASEISSVQFYENSSDAVEQYDNDEADILFSHITDALRFTDYYEIEWKYGAVKIVARPVRIRTNSLYNDYAGKPQCADGYEILSQDGYYSLAEGQDLVLTYKQWTNVGEYINEPEGFVFIAGDADVSENYSPSWEYGDVEITKKRISVVTMSKEVYYNGKSNHPENADEAIENSHDILCGDDFFRVSYNMQSSMTHVNETGYENHPQIYMFNPDEENVSDNYDAAITYGKIIVKKRTLAVTIHDRELVYNGEMQGLGEFGGFSITNKSEEGGGLADGQELMLYGKTGRIDCGSQDIDCTYKVISEGIATTANYNVEITTGKLTITQRDLSLQTKSAEKVYDGTPLTCGEINIESGLVQGHTFAISVQGEMPAITELGEKTNEFAFVLQIFEEGDVEVTTNYNVEKALLNVEYGKLSVKSRKLALTIADKECEYDSLPHGYTKDDIVISGDGMPEEREQTLMMTFAQFVDVGSHTNNDVYTSCKVYEGDVDVTDNYMFEMQIGTFTISRRKVTLTTGSGEKEILYDGEKHSVKSYSDDLSRLISGHKVVAYSYYSTFYPEYENAGTYQNMPLENAWTIVDESERDVKNNYDITWAPGDIVIIPRPITVQTGAIDTEYDGNAHYNNKFEITSQTQLVDGQKLQLTFRSDGFTKVPQPTDVDMDKNFAKTYTIKKADGTDVQSGTRIKDTEFNNTSKNYDITWVWGEVNIRPIEIKIRLKNSVSGWNWTYDGTSHIKHGDYVEKAGGYAIENTDFEIESGKLMVLNNLYVGGFDKTTKAGKYVLGDDGFELTFSVWFMQLSDRSYNYHITYDSIIGTPLSIAKRSLQVTTESRTGVYDKENPLSAGVNDSGVEEANGERGLLSSQKFEVIESTKVDHITDVPNNAKTAYIAEGYVENRVTEWKITDSDGNDFTDCYDITWQYGNLRVKSPIEVYVYSLTKYYDGKEVSLESCKTKIKTLPFGISESDVHIVLSGGSITKPGAITLEQVTVASRSTSTVISSDEIYRIDFIGQTNVIEIKKQRLTIVTNSAVVVKGNDPIYGKDLGNNGYSVSGRLAKGDTLSVAVIGELNLSDEAATNAVDKSSVKVTDAGGNDVTDCYDIVCKEGELRWAV